MTDEKYVGIYNELITRRYDYLLNCASNILKSNKNMDAGDLLGELIIYLSNNKVKVVEYIEIDKLEAFCVSWMNIQGRHHTSPLNKKYSSKAYSIDDFGVNSIILDDAIAFDLDKNEYEKDLIPNYSDEQIEKIMKIDKILDKLNETDMILFKAYFVENLSYDKICKKYTFYKTKMNKKILYKSKKSIYNLMKDLKIKINILIREI